MSDTKIMPCTCDHPAQDRLHGPEKEFAVVEEHEELITLAMADAEAHECTVGDDP